MAGDGPAPGGDEREDPVESFRRSQNSARAHALALEVAAASLVRDMPPDTPHAIAITAHNLLSVAQVLGRHFAPDLPPNSGLPLSEDATEVLGVLLDEQWWDERTLVLELTHRHPARWSPVGSYVGGLNERVTSALIEIDPIFRLDLEMGGVNALPREGPPPPPGHRDMRPYADGPSRYVPKLSRVKLRGPFRRRTR